MEKSKPNPNDAFYKKAEQAFRSLFDTACTKHELHFAMALMPEMRGMQDAGWNTAAETQHAFDEYLEFLSTLEDGRMKCRIALSFYSHISEASGFYEVPKNMLRIAGGQSHVLWPFMELVQSHKQTGAQIAPNANKVLKDLAGHAKELGLNDLAEIFRDAFDPDVRNAYVHADYVVWNDGLRLPKRNGGYARKIPWDEFTIIFDRGVNFFHILREIISEYIRSYDPPKTIRARLQQEPEADWTIYYDANSGGFGVTSGKYPKDT
ncbi:hypothetical protein J2T55_000797 [Methylohalomonas lacus]|uniref:Uncharacterized protein n=1 Tax=Methylohalomonas lacus TaxID=398773 RepID=A0AAE3HKB8_9GAMM|nr:hypothetical protein [Methylohalomonas lacus]MCS3902793.1 hypothetical protein [Methylohalomonas lacus]